jgi:hypothetical protein
MQSNEAGEIIMITLKCGDTNKIMM